MPRKTFLQKKSIFSSDFKPILKQTSQKLILAPSVSATEKKRVAFPPSPPSGAAQHLNGGYGNSWDAPWVCHVKQDRGKIVVYRPCISVGRSQHLGAYRAGKQLAIKDKN